MKPPKLIKHKNHSKDHPCKKINPIFLNCKTVRSCLFIFPFLTAVIMVHCASFWCFKIQSRWPPAVHPSKLTTMAMVSIRSCLFFHPFLIKLMVIKSCLLSLFLISNVLFCLHIPFHPADATLNASMNWNLDWI